MDKIINVLKPPGMTSFDVVKEIKRVFGTKKVGHTGTLDSDAAGVLPICINRATKVCDLILEKDKTYLCEMTLGAVTDTYDSSGMVMERSDYSNTKENDIICALNSYIGIIKQKAPIYSALKVSGKRMSDIAREEGLENIEPKIRKVKIHSIEVISIDIPKVLFRVHCSKGTYIRSLCKDVGDVLNTGAYLSFLLRESTGNFHLEESLTLNEIHSLSEEKKLEKYLYDVDYALKDMGRIDINRNAMKYYLNGGKINPERYTVTEKNTQKESYRVYCDGLFLGIGKLTDYQNKKHLYGVKRFYMGN